MAGTLPPLFTITPDDHAGYIAVASYTFLVLMVCLVATRVFTRWYVVRYVKFDDVLLTIAAVCSPSHAHLLLSLFLLFGTPDTDMAAQTIAPGPRAERAYTDGPETWLGPERETGLFQRFYSVPKGRRKSSR